MLMVDGQGTPLSACTTAADASEVHAIDKLVDLRLTEDAPGHLLYDKADDADWLRTALNRRGIALSARTVAIARSYRSTTAAR